MFLIKIENLTIENASLKSSYELKAEISTPSTMQEESINKRAKQGTLFNLVPSRNSLNITNFIIDNTKDTEPSSTSPSLNDIMKWDRLQVENVALRQKLRLMAEEEKYMIQQLQGRSGELNDARSQIVNLKRQWSNGIFIVSFYFKYFFLHFLSPILFLEALKINSFQLSQEGERDELVGKLLVAERKIEHLEG